MNTVFERIKELVSDSEPDLEKFINGTRAAGKRVRKNMMEIKKLSHELRQLIQEEVNERKG